MKNYEIISIEPSNLAHYWVISFKINGEEIEKETVEALDPHEAFIKFRNQMIMESKSQCKAATKKI